MSTRTPTLVARPCRIAAILVAGLLVAACSPAASPSPVSPSPTVAPAQSSTASDGAPPAGTPAPTPSATLPPLPPSGSLPVRTSAWKVGVDVAPAPDGMLYVLVSQRDEAVAALLDRAGQPTPGWPIAIDAAPDCPEILAAADGSVRIICRETDATTGYTTKLRAFAFDSNARPRSGWPVELACCADGRIVARVIGDRLVVFEHTTDEGYTNVERVTTIAADGAIERGTPTSSANCCGESFSIGPDGIAYGVRSIIEDKLSEASSELRAIGPAGPVRGFPVTFEGLVSPPGFDAGGRIYVTVASRIDVVTYRGPAEVRVFDDTGREVGDGSGLLDLAATDTCDGIEGTCVWPAAPLVGSDGTVVVMESHYTDTTALMLRPSGEVLPGWPYRSDEGFQPIGVCAEGDICEGSAIAIPALGPNDVLYLVHRSAGPSVGGSLVAVGRDGRVRPGWPVELKRVGSDFWSVVVGADGTAYALAIEAEVGGTASASVLAIAPDSTVVSVTTIIEP